MKPRWFQVHLSTAIISMISASGLLLWNIEKWKRHVQVEPWMTKSDIGQGNALIYLDRTLACITSIVLLLCLIIVCEFIIRRREARKP
jgi:hypothetical protein